MFRTYRWEVGNMLVPGSNTLTFTFDSPVECARRKEAEYPLGGTQPVSLLGGPYLRKAPSHFGWDWGPMLPPIGIWKDLRLEGHSTERLDIRHFSCCARFNKGYKTRR
jgi:beta-mannosidase